MAEDLKIAAQEIPGRLEETENEEYNEESKGLNESNTDISASFDRLESVFRYPEEDDYAKTIEDEGEGQDEYKSKKKTEYVSGLSKFGWMRTIPDEVEEHNKLTREMIHFGMSQIGRAIDSTEMAYLKCEIRSKYLQNIDNLGKFAHLRNIDLSDNYIISLNALAPIKNLQVLNVAGNKITSFEDIPQFVWLQALNISKNELTNLDGMRSNYLTYLNLSNNHLNSTTYFIGEIFPNLILLELRGNDFSSISGMELPKLRHLYVAKNMLSDLDGIEYCPQLEYIHARENIVTSLTNFPNLPKLKYINLRNNNIRRFTELTHLGNSEALESVVLLENPICESERYRSEVTAAILAIKRLDKTLVSEIEKVEGRHLRSGRLMRVIPPLEDDYSIATPRNLEQGGEVDGDE